MTIGTYAMDEDLLEAMSASRSYVQSAMVFAYAQSNVFVTPLARLFAPFQQWIWYSILFLLSGSIGILLLSKKLTRWQRHFIIGGYKNRTPVMNMLSSVMGITIPNRRMRQQKYFGVFARTLTILWILFWLVVRNAYQSSLYGFLHSERVTSIYDSFDKIKSSNCNIYMMDTAMKYIPKGLDKQR